MKIRHETLWIDLLYYKSKDAYNQQKQKTRTLEDGKLLHINYIEKQEIN